MFIIGSAYPMLPNNDRSFKSRTSRRLWLYCMKLINIVLMTAPFAACWYIFYAGGIKNPFFNKGNWVVVGLFALLYIVFCKLYSGLSISTKRITEAVYSQTLSAFISNAFMYIVISLLSSGFVSFPELLLALVIQFTFSVIWTYIVHRIYFKKLKPMSTIFVYDMRENIDDFVKPYYIDKRFDIKQILHTEECLLDLNITLKDTDTVFLCGVHSSERNQIIKHCVRSGIRVYVIPRVGDVLMSGAKPVHMFHIPMMTLKRYDPSAEYLLVKRVFDIIISCLALIVLSPVMLAVALIIKSDGGTVFYTQKRLTKDRKEFSIIKFRSMKMDAEKDGVARLSSGDSDERITPIGKVIRKLRIDELPQLFCVIKGDLSIVGPRPERPEIAEQYEKEMPEFALRLQAKAGLTGLAQVYGKYSTTPYDKLLMDLQYIANPSVVSDLKIIFATVKILFMPESTEGVKKGRHTAFRDNRFMPGQITVSDISDLGERNDKAAI